MLSNEIMRLSITQFNDLMKTIKENVIDLDDRFSGVSDEKIMKLLGIYTWENDYYIKTNDVNSKTGGNKNKTGKSKSKNSKTRKNKKIL
jgi:hypothetical protein